MLTGSICQAGNRAVFLDRDGVLNRKACLGEYVADWHALELLPGVREAVARLNRAGFRTFVVSNQRGVALGKVQLANLLEIHRQLQKSFQQAEAFLEAIYYCPHDLASGCGCRKPAPGMLLQAANDHRIDLRQSWMIGDSAGDIAAGRRAGCKTAQLVDSGNLSSLADVIARGLPEAVDQILAIEANRSRVHSTDLQS